MSEHDGTTGPGDWAQRQPPPAPPPYGDPPDPNGAPTPAWGDPAKYPTTQHPGAQYPNAGYPSGGYQHPGAGGPTQQYPTQQYPGPYPGQQYPGQQYPAGPYPGAGGPSQPDWLSSSTPGQPRRRRGRLMLAVAVSVVAVLGITGGAYAVLGNHDTAPDHYVPADAIGVVSVNLDPSTAQEVAALRFFAAFPSLGTRSGADNLIDGVLRSALDGTDIQNDFEQDIRPWLGSRVAVAADPQGGKVRPLLVAEVTDQDKARAGLTRLSKDENDVGYTFRDNYVIISDSTGAADRAATDAATSSLADDARYQKGLDTLDSDRVIDGWVDLDRARTAEGSEFTEIRGLPGTKGQVAFEVRFGAKHAELYATVNGVSSMPPGAIGSDIATLPDDTSVAVGLTGLDRSVTQALDALDATGLGNPLDELSAQTGLNLPDDITGLLGDQTVLAANSNVSGVGLITSADPAAAKASADKLLTALGDPEGVTVGQQGDHTVLASSPDYADELAAGGNLGKQDRFRTAVPDAAQASALVYVDVPRVLALDPGSIPADAKHLRSFGLTVTGHGSTATIRMRLVVD